MNEKQLADFTIWKQNPDQPLPESLKGILIEDCLEELKTWNVLENYDILKMFSTQKFYLFPGDCCLFKPNLTLINQEDPTNILFIQTLLSRTPDGQAVMEFLDVETQEYKNDIPLLKQLPKGDLLKNKIRIKYGYCPHTLDHLLYREFTEALRIGKTFDQALETITKIYLLHLYA